MRALQAFQGDCTSFFHSQEGPTDIGKVQRREARTLRAGDQGRRVQRDPAEALRGVLDHAPAALQGDLLHPPLERGHGRPETDGDHQNCQFGGFLINFHENH